MPFNKEDSGSDPKFVHPDVGSMEHVEAEIEGCMNQLLYIADLVKVEEPTSRKRDGPCSEAAATLSRVKRFAKALKKAIPKVEAHYNQLIGNPIDIEKITVDIRTACQKIKRQRYCSCQLPTPVDS
jgi:hypothetical protein